MRSDACPSKLQHFRLGVVFAQVLREVRTKGKGASGASRNNFGPQLPLLLYN